MAENAEENRKLPFVDDPLASELFADDAFGFFLKNGNVSIALSSIRFNHSSEVPIANRVIVGRVTMPVAGIQQLVIGLYDFLKQRGLDPIQSVSSDQETKQ